MQDPSPQESTGTLASKFHVALEKWEKSGKTKEAEDICKKEVSELVQPSQARIRNKRTGNSWLLQAACGDALFLVQHLVEVHSFDVNDENRKRQNILYYAVSNRNPDMIRFAVSKGCPVDKTFWSGNCMKTYLLWMTEEACKNDSKAIPCIHALVEMGANVNWATSKYNWTPLLIAVNNGNAQLVEYFLEKGADPNAKVCIRCSPH